MEKPSFSQDTVVMQGNKLSIFETEVSKNSIYSCSMRSRELNCDEQWFAWRAWGSLSLNLGSALEEEEEKERGGPVIDEEEIFD